MTYLINLNLTSREIFLLSCAITEQKYRWESKKLTPENLKIIKEHEDLYLKIKNSTTEETIPNPPSSQLPDTQGTYTCPSQPILPASLNLPLIWWESLTYKQRSFLRNIQSCMNDETMTLYWYNKAQTEDLHKLKDWPFTSDSDMRKI